MTPEDKAQLEREIARHKQHVAGVIWVLVIAFAAGIVYEWLKAHPP